MHNANDPGPSELPSSARLFRSTLIALLAAAVILVAVVLPAEYAIDPTGMGRVLGLTEMGEIKAQLDREADGDLASSESQAVQSASGGGEAPDSVWKDEISVTLAADEAIELKLVMAAGAEAQFEWAAEGGVVNYDLHGDGGGEFTSYEKGAGSSGKAGALRAAFDGQHGWHWRNRMKAPVTVTLRTRGDYAEIKRMM
jgi:hypothetical protein